MKATDLNLEQVNYRFCETCPARSHYRFSMSMGNILPSTRAQTLYFVKNCFNLGVLTSADVNAIESLLNKHGLEGDYKYTKSKSFVRLRNCQDLVTALKAEYC